jgi:hypothetical protein
MKKRIATIVATLALFALPAMPQNNVSRYNYTHISTATNTLIATKPTELHTIVVNIGTTSPTVTVVDSTSSTCSGGTAVSGAAVATAGSTLTFDVVTANGLCIVTAGATIDVTVSWR